MKEGSQNSEAKQRALKAKFFEMLLYASADGIVITDATRGIVIANEVFCALFGKTLGEVCDTSMLVWLEQLDPGSLESWAGLERRLHLKGEARGIEFRMTAKGKVRHLSVDASLLEKGVTEENAVIISTWRDITERKQIEEQLGDYPERIEGLTEDRLAELKQEIRERKAAEKELQLLSSTVEQSTEGIAVADLEGNLIFMNKAFAAMHGYTREELFGKPISLLHTPEQVPSVEAANRQLMENGEFSGQIWHVRRDGSVFPALMQNSLLRDEQGNHVGLIGTMRDITQLKQAEETLRKERDFSKSLIQTSPAFFVAISAEGKTLMMNRAMLTSLGYRESEAVGTNYLKTFIPERKRKTFAKIFKKLVHLKEPTSSEDRVLAKDGKELLVEWHGRPVFKENGEFDFFFGVGNDITERRKADEELRKHREHLEELVKERTAELQKEIVERKRAEEDARIRHEQLMQADKMVALGTLVSGIGHEINNPINFVMLNIPLLRGIWEIALPILDEYSTEHCEFRLGGIPYSKARQMIPELFDDIHEGACRIKRITSELRDYARPRKKDQNELVAVNKVLRSAVVLLKTFINRRTRHFTAEYSENLPNVRGSTQHIEQVFINLLQNACEALQDKSEKIFVKTLYDKKRGGVVITVKDEGEGITKENIRHITNPFFTTKHHSGGTGLGLSIAARIVHDHGGTLTFESIPEKGTLATAFFPMSLHKQAKEES